MITHALEHCNVVVKHRIIDREVTGSIPQAPRMMLFLIFYIFSTYTYLVETHTYRLGVAIQMITQIRFGTLCYSGKTSDSKSLGSGFGPRK